MVLVIAGCGVHSGSFTRELLEALDEADIIYVDLYTMPGSSWILEALKKWSDKVRVASRELLESQSKIVIGEAVDKHVLIISAGDPLVATTHQSLLAEAMLAGVLVKYIPGISGVCIAKAYSGLSYYRFGRTVTVPGPWRGLKPYSVITVIYANLCIDSHTLILLDVSDKGVQLSPRDAVLELLKVEREISETLGLKRVLEVTPIIIVESAGAPGAGLKVYNSIGDLARSREEFKIPSSLIIPAPLNPVELWIIELRLGVKLDSVWSRRVYERSECCKSYETLMSWLSSG